MVLTPIAINSSKRINKIREVINEGVDVYSAHYRLGGHCLETSNQQHQQKMFELHRLGGSRINHAESQEVIAQTIRHKHLKKYLRLCENLKNNNYWETLKNTQASKQNQIGRLQSEWMLHSKYAHFTVTGLFSAKEILETLQTQVNVAKKETNRPFYGLFYANTSKNDISALAALESEIDSERNGINEALVYRLSLTFKYHSLDKCNPVYALTDQLHQLNVNLLYGITNNNEVSRPEPFPIAKAYAHLLQHGNEAIKNRLNCYFSLKDQVENTLDISVLKQGDKAFLVPENCSHLIPTTRPFWTRLIPGYRHRYEFMHGKTKLLFELLDVQHIPDPKNKEPDSQMALLKYLNVLTRKLEQQSEQKPPKIQQWFPFLYTKNTRLYTAWNRIVDTQKIDLTRKQLTCLDALAQNTRSDISDILEDADTQEQDKNKIIEDTLNTLENRLTNVSFCEEDRTHLQKIKQRRNSGNNAGIQLESGILSKLYVLADNKPLAVEIHEVFFSTLDKISKENPSRLVEITMDNQSIIFQLIEQMSTRIAALPAKIKDNHPVFQDTVYLIQAADVLSHFYPLLEAFQTLHEIKEAIVELLKGYPDFIKNLTTEAAHAKKDNLESMHKALFHIMSLPMDYSEEKKTLAKSAEFLSDRLEGQKPVDVEKFLAANKRERERTNEELRLSDMLLQSIRQITNTENDPSEGLPRSQSP